MNKTGLTVTMGCHSLKESKSLAKMTEEPRFQSKFLKGRLDELEYLKGIDYAGLNSKIDEALNSTSAAKRVDAKKMLISTYDSRVLIKKEDCVPIPHIDQEIDQFIGKYTETRARLDAGILQYRSSSEAVFAKEYGSKAPDIAKLRAISDDYAMFQETERDLDHLLMNYSAFSRDLRKAEQKIDNATKEYKNINDYAQGKSVRAKIEECKKEIADIREKSPKRILRGMHPAYDYRSENLKMLDSELERFEKEKFIDKKNSAKEELWLAGSLIERLGNASDGDAYEILAEFARQNLSDFREFEKTMYFGDIAQDHSGFIRELKSLAKKRAQKCQAGESQNLGAIVNETLNTKKLDELKSRRAIIQNSYSEKANLLYTISGDDALKQNLESSMSSIDQSIADIMKQQEGKRQHELSKKQIEADEKLRRDELGRKYDFEKQAEEFRKKEETFERRLQEIEREGASYASGLKKEKEDKKAQEKTIDALMENIGKTLQVGKESMDDLGKELSSGLYKKFCDQLERELKRVEESISAYGSNTNVLAGRINAFQSDLTAIRAELTEIRKERGQEVKQQKNISNPVHDSLGGINKKLEEIAETINKQTTGQPSTVMHIDTYINNLTVVEQKGEKKMFDFIYTVKSMLPPKNMDLNRVRDRILKNTKMNLPDKLLSLRDYFGSDWTTVRDSDDLDWLKDFRDSLVDEINFGVTGHRIRKGGLIRVQFNDIINRVIDPYIARCEQALGTCVN